MKAQSNIKPNTIQDLGNNTYYFNYNVEFVNNMWMYDSILLKMPVSKDAIITALIREKYTLDDELAITNNRMSVFDANLLPKEKEDEYSREYYAYQQYREECKKKAREIGGI